MPLPTSRFYDITYEPDPPLLLGTSLRVLSAEEMTESGELLLEAARRHSCPYWLLDGRRHGPPQPSELHEWVKDEFFPRVRADLGQAVCVAFLPQHLDHQLPATLAATALQEWQTPAVRLGWFLDETQARAWLRRYQTQ